MPLLSLRDAALKAPARVFSALPGDLKWGARVDAGNGGRGGASSGCTLGLLWSGLVPGNWRGMRGAPEASRPGGPRVLPAPREPHLGKHVGVGVVLQQHSGRPRVVVAGRDVQGGQAHLALRAVVDEVCHHVLVALLQGHGQRGEAVLAGAKERPMCTHRPDHSGPRGGTRTFELKALALGLGAPPSSTSCKLSSDAASSLMLSLAPLSFSAIS